MKPIHPLPRILALLALLVALAASGSLASAAPLASSPVVGAQSAVRIPISATATSLGQLSRHSSRGRYYG